MCAVLLGCLCFSRPSVAGTGWQCNGFKHSCYSGHQTQNQAIKSDALRSGRVKLSQIELFLCLSQEATLAVTFNLPQSH